MCVKARARVDARVRASVRWCPGVPSVLTVLNACKLPTTIARQSASQRSPPRCDDRSDDASLHLSHIDAYGRAVCISLPQLVHTALNGVAHRRAGAGVGGGGGGGKDGSSAASETPPPTPTTAAVDMPTCMPVSPHLGVRQVRVTGEGRGAGEGEG